ncbi:MAG: U32 family peptidase [Coriobacteriales bacterium]|jgi:putative protease|nr:U32 family peptidase [Coriobacteriales bacterium]
MITSKPVYQGAPAAAGAKPELLAPAGSHDAFLAALSAGADAIYLGVEDFNARRNADNFSLETLAELCDLAHLANRRVYLTLNTMIRPDELERALEVAWRAWEAGADALIVQDLGLLARVAREMPRFELHASTQMNLHNAASVRLAAEMGASRVTLARELSLEELSEIAQAGVPLEVFAHGALCVCYSGQCLLSSLVGRRSANRGLCAQACRLPYQLIDTSTGKRVKTPGEHLLSPADLATLDILPALAATGVAALKIEGRMKSASYVAAVTRAYRQALDALDTPAAGACPSTPLDTLAESFSRGFTTAYLEGERGNSIMSYERPNNQGVLVGRVGSLERGRVAIDLTKRVVRGDVLEFRTSRGRVVVTLDEFWGAAAGDAPALEAADEGTRLYLRVPEPVGAGDRVFRVRSAALLNDVESSFGSTVFQGNNGLIALDARVVARQGEPLTIGFCLRDDERSEKGAWATARGAVVEAARTKAVTADDIREHVGRIGGTPFTIRSWDIQLDEGVGMGFAALHRLRAEALEALSAQVLKPWRKRVSTPHEALPALAPARKGSPRIAAIVRDEAGIRAALQGGAEAIYLHTLHFEATEGGGVDRGVAAGRATTEPSIIRLLPAITHDAQLAALKKRLADGQTAVANNLGEVELLRGAGHALEAGPSLGVSNAATLETLARLGLAQAWLSPELSSQDITRIAPTSPLPLALTVFGRQEVMVTEHCLLMAQGPCDQRCAVCARRKAPRLLEDRKGYRLPVRTDEFGRSHLFNAVPLDLVPAMPELVSLGISTLVVDGTLLTTKELKAEVARAAHARDLALKGAGTLPRREGYTTGHFFRGVW